jgi:putative peptidoglycan lipid II flippase
MTWSLGLLALAMLLVLVGAPFYLPWLATGFGAEKITLARELLYVLAPLVMLTGVITIWGSVLTAGERFALPALTPITTPLVAIAFVVIGGSAWGIFALAVGTVGGAGLEAALLGFALKRQGVHLRPVWHGADAHLRRVIAQYIPMIAGAFLMSGTNLVDQAMAAMLAPGSVAALNYGNRIIGLPLNLAASALGTAVIPYFSGMVSRQDWAGVRHTFYRYLGLILATTVPLTLLLVLFSELLVRVVFERGAFTAQDTVLVARVQSFFSLQIPFFLAGILVVRLISAMHANQVLMWGAVINLVVNIVLAYLLMMRIGVAGIALATSVMYFVSFAFLYYNWRRLFKDAR